MLSDEQVGRLAGGLTVAIGACNSIVIDKPLANSCTINDRIALCPDQAKNASLFATCVARLTTELTAARIITDDESRTMQRCSR
jgi:hypothetical protein